MKIFVKTKVGAKEEKVEKIDDTHFIVSVRERPIKGKANKAVVRVLSDYFGTEAVITSGFRSTNKTMKLEI